MAPKRTKCGLILGLVGVIFGICLIPFGDWLVEIVVRKEMRLVNGSMGYELWADQRKIPVYMQYWVFNVTNVDEILRGGKPYLTQHGPYTYREYRWKENITHYPNGTVSFRQLKNYIFMRDMSVGNESDVLTTINLVFCVIGQAVKWEPNLIQLAAAVGAMLQDEPLFLQKTVHEILWGYQDPLLHLMKQIAPTWFNDDVAAVMKNKNNTADGLYTVFTGESNHTRTGVILYFNRTRLLPFWTTEWANMINGTDGTTCPPYYAVDKSLSLPLFNSDVCRSAYGTYHGPLSTPQGIPLQKYTAPDSALSADSPDMAGFCTPPGNCLPSGLLNLSTCQMVDGFHVPVVMSLPHFFLADPEVRAQIDGMRPDRHEHETIVAVEPHVGLAMVAYKRIQANVYLEQSKHLPQTRNVKSMYFPVMWLNESAVISDEDAAKFHRMFVIPRRILHYGAIVLIVGGALLAIICGYLLISKRAPKPLPLRTVTADERTALISSEART